MLTKSFFVTLSVLSHLCVAVPTGEPAPPDVAYSKNCQHTPTNIDLLSLEDRMIRRIQQVDQKYLEIQGICPVFYNGKCFWGVFMGPSTTRYTNARELCARRGGRPAGIYNKEHYDLLVAMSLPYIAAKENKAMAMWTGMKTNTKDGFLTQFDGSPAPSLKWSQGYPKIGSQYASSTGVFLRLSIKPDGLGMTNFPLSVVGFGALCERQL